jgi:hypothetical protein
MSRERKRLAAAGFNLGCRCLQILCLAAGDNHFGSGLGESKCYGLTDAAAAAGYHCYFSF